MTNRAAIVVALLLSLALAGCGARDRNTIESADTNENIAVASELENAETQVKIAVPADWTLIRDDRRQSADIQASYPPANLHAKVLSESASGLSVFSLEDNAEQYRWLIQQELDRFDRETPTGLTSINGKRAVQYEMRGTVDGVSIVYLHTTVEGLNDYYQIVGWTTEESYQENKETLQKIVESFRAT